MRRVVTHFSRFQGFGALVLFIFVMTGGSQAIAADAAAKGQTADVGNVDVGKVFSVHTLLGRPVNDVDKKSLGVATDLAIDLDDANVAMIAVRPKKASGGSSTISATPVWLVPARLLGALDNDQAPIQLTSALPDNARVDSTDWRSTATREWAKKALGQKDKTPGNEPAVYTKFAWVSSLEGTPVTDPKGETLGTITDVALTRHPLHVAYVVLNPAGVKEQAAGGWGVPLSALVVPLTEKTWQLELPADRLAKIPKIDPRHLPHKVDRAWEEYVSVSYGGAIDDGTQPEPRAK